MFSGALFSFTELMAEIWKRSQSEEGEGGASDNGMDEAARLEIVPAGTIESLETLGRFPFGILTNSNKPLFLLRVSYK